MLLLTLFYCIAASIYRVFCASYDYSKFIGVDCFLFLL